MVSSLILSYENDPVLHRIPHHVASELKNYHILAIREIFNCFHSKQNGIIMNEEHGMNFPLQISAFLSTYKEDTFEDDPILLITKENNVNVWKSYISNHTKFSVMSFCDYDDTVNPHGLIIMGTDVELKKCDKLKEGDYFMVVVEELDKVIKMRAMSGIRGTFHLGCTERNFYSDRDMKLLWKMMKWAEPGKIAKFQEFSDEYNDCLVNLIEPFPEIWFRLTWNFCEAFEKPEEEEVQLNPSKEKSPKKKSNKKRKSDQRSPLNTSSGKRAKSDSSSSKPDNTLLSLSRCNLSFNSSDSSSDFTNTNCERINNPNSSRNVNITSSSFRRNSCENTLNTNSSSGLNSSGDKIVGDSRKTCEVDLNILPFDKSSEQESNWKKRKSGNLDNSFHKTNADCNKISSGSEQNYCSNSKGTPPKKKKRCDFGASKSIIDLFEDYEKKPDLESELTADDFSLSLDSPAIAINDDSENLRNDEDIPTLFEHRNTSMNPPRINEKEIIDLSSSADDDELDLPTLSQISTPFTKEIGNKTGEGKNDFMEESEDFNLLTVLNKNELSSDEMENNEGNTCFFNSLFNQNKLSGFNRSINVEVDAVSPLKDVEINRTDSFIKNVGIIEPISTMKNCGIDKLVSPVKNVNSKKSLSTVKKYGIDNHVSPIEVINKSVSPIKNVDFNEPISTTKHNGIDKLISPVKNVNINKSVTSTKQLHIDKSARRLDFNQSGKMFEKYNNKTIECEKVIPSTSKDISNPFEKIISHFSKTSKSNPNLITKHKTFSDLPETIIDANVIDEFSSDFITPPVAKKSRTLRKTKSENGICRMKIIDKQVLEEFARDFEMGAPKKPRTLDALIFKSVSNFFEGKADTPHSSSESQSAENVWSLFRKGCRGNKGAGDVDGNNFENEKLNESGESKKNETDAHVTFKQAGNGENCKYLETKLKGAGDFTRNKTNINCEQPFVNSSNYNSDFVGENATNEAKGENKSNTNQSNTITEFREETNENEDVIEETKINSISETQIVNSVNENEINSRSVIEEILNDDSFNSRNIIETTLNNNPFSTRNTIEKTINNSGNITDETLNKNSFNKRNIIKKNINNNPLNSANIIEETNNDSSFPGIWNPITVIEATHNVSVNRDEDIISETACSISKSIYSQDTQLNNFLDSLEKSADCLDCAREKRFAFCENCKKSASAVDSSTLIANNSSDTKASACRANNGSTSTIDKSLTCRLENTSVYKDNLSTTGENRASAVNESSASVSVGSRNLNTHNDSPSKVDKSTQLSPEDIVNSGESNADSIPSRNRFKNKETNTPPLHAHYFSDKRKSFGDGNSRFRGSLFGGDREKGGGGEEGFRRKYSREKIISSVFDDDDKMDIFGDGTYIKSFFKEDEDDEFNNSELWSKSVEEEKTERVRNEILESLFGD